MKNRILEENANFEAICEQIDTLFEKQTVIRDSLKANLASHGIVSEDNKLSALVEKVKDIQTNLEFSPYTYGDSMFLGTPKPVLILDTISYHAPSKKIGLGNNKYVGTIYGNSNYVQNTGNISTDGTCYIETGYAMPREGAIVLKFDADETKASNVYARLFRTDTDGISMFYKDLNASGTGEGTYEIKLYSGGYIGNISPSLLKNKRLLITWSAKKGILDLYIDGELYNSMSINSNKVLTNKNFYFGDNQQYEEGRVPFYLPHTFYEFKVYDCYIDAQMAKEV